MNLANKNVLTRLLSAAPPAVLRAGCVALFACVSACGGGNDAAPPATSVSAPAPVQAPNAGQCSTQQPPGTALSIDSAASGNPVNLRVALSANGDGFAVWQANDGTRRNLWANRYCAATAGWGSPINIEASSNDIDDFDLTVDATGNAVVAWHELSPAAPPPGPPNSDGPVRGTRFDASAGAWAMPTLLNAEARQPRVASNATGDVLAVYVHDRLTRGRFFDPVSGTWLPEATIEENPGGSGEPGDPMAVVDGSGNALAYWRAIRTSAEALGSAYFSRGNGGWPQPIGDGGVPGSFVFSGALQNLQLTTASDGNFLAAWENVTSPSGAGNYQIKILTARFISGTQEWSAVQTLVPDRGQNIQLQRMGSDASGKALVLWTETDGARTALKAMRVDDTGAACSAVQVIDSAIGGGAARADLGVDPQGQAIAIWQQFEGGRPDDGSRSNIAINRFDGSTGTWAGAAFAETQPGNAISPHTSASGGHALLGWIQAEEGANRVKALLQPLADTSH